MKQYLDYLKVLIALLGVISMWTIYFLRQNETAPVHSADDVPIQNIVYEHQ